jgi:hypothetical protein
MKKEWQEDVMKKRPWTVVICCGAICLLRDTRRRNKRCSPEMVRRT